MVGSIVSFFFRLVAAVLFYATPLIGFWVASSLAAYLGSPKWVAWTVGAMLFPIIPGAWEFHTWAWRDPNKKTWLTSFDRLSLKTFGIGLLFLVGLLYFQPQSAFIAISTRGDWMLDGVKDPRAEKARQCLYVAANELEWLYKFTKKNPYTDYIDAQARRQTEKAEKQLAAKQLAQKNADAARNTQTKSADSVDKSNAESTKIASKQDNDSDSLVPVGDSGDRTDLDNSENNQDSTQDEDQAANKMQDEAPDKVQDVSNTKVRDNAKAKAQDNSKDRKNEEPKGRSKVETALKQKNHKPNKKRSDTKNEIAAQNNNQDETLTSLWPLWQPGIHPVVANMPKSAETSISSVAHYISQREKDPFLLVKALHDYVADRVAYDAKSYYSGNIPDQDAKTTFKKRVSVCAGYANLLSALGEAIGQKIVVVSGDARESSAADINTKLAGNGHAWNAAKIQGRWYLIDACWDSGYTSRAKGFEKNYRTEYLMPPPVVMISNHFPDDTTWQLLKKPLSRGEFLRQPMLAPSFQAAHLELVAPTRATNEANSNYAVVEIKNPDQIWLMANLEQNGRKIETSTVATNDTTALLQKVLPRKGTYTMNLFANKTTQYGQYDYIGSVDFVSR
ncbi:MAG TPA: transglutaminase domain-containing protein [Drouetiella sp.]